MGTDRYSSESLKILLNKQKIATLSELKVALGTNVDMTIFRKLRELSYRTSYSHRGQYYTLNRIAKFNEVGLWFHQSVCFSQYGNLMETVKFFVSHSEAGQSAHELDVILKIKTKEPLLCLFRQGAIYRKKLSKVCIYFSADPKIQRRQILFRQDLESEAETYSDRTATILFFTLLDEKQRRLYAGLEAFRYGYGGNKKIADNLGLQEYKPTKIPLLKL